MDGNPNGSRRRARGRAFALRASLLALLWLAITGAELAALVVGVPTAMLAAALSLSRFPPQTHRWSAGGGLRFVGFFLGQSLLGAWDVARRALSPGPPIAPALVPYNVRLPEGSARWLFCATLSLLPGTSAVSVHGPQVVIHVLDVERASPAAFARVEQRAAAVFGIALEEEHPPESAS